MSYEISVDTSITITIIDRIIYMKKIQLNWTVISWGKNNFVFLFVVFLSQLSATNWVTVIQYSDFKRGFCSRIKWPKYSPTSPTPGVQKIKTLVNWWKWCWLLKHQAPVSIMPEMMRKCYFDTLFLILLLLDEISYWSQ